MKSDLYLMKSFGNRIKYLRKQILNLTQVQFAERLSLTGSAVTGWEKNNRYPTNSTIKHISKEFNVNYNWLVYGTGEIFEKTDDDFFEQLIEKYNLSDAKIKIIKAIINSDDLEIDILLNTVNNIFSIK